MVKWPKRKELDQVLKELENEPGSRPLRPNATPIEQTKHEICAEFVKYMQKHDLTQRDLASQLGLDEALVSKIVRYHFDDFTIDRLYGYLAKLDSNFKLSVNRKDSSAA